MIGTTTLKQSLGVDIAVSAPMATALQTWAAMYQNQATWLGEYVKSLNLPAAIAGEIARSATIEMKVNISGSARAAFLAEQIERVLPRLREMVEFGGAKGGLMLKPYVTGGGLAVDYVQADQFYPVSFDANGGITACVFSDQRKIGQYWYTRLEFHRLMKEDAGAWVQIKNFAFKSLTQGDLGQSVPLTSVDAWADIEPDGGITGVDRLLVGYFKNPGANNIDPTSPLGVSCYARAVDLIEQADRQWSDFLWEFESGKRAVYADVLAFDLDADGKPRLPDKRLYRALKQSGQIGDGGKLFEEWSPTLREVNLLNGLDAILKKIEFNCGLAFGTISDPNIVAATATEIKMQKQRSYATITDTQKALQYALDSLLYAMNAWADAAGLAPAGSYQVVYEFDDSVVADKDTQLLQDNLSLGQGTLAKYEWRMRQYGETEEVARQKIADIRDESPLPSSLFGPPPDTNLTDQTTDKAKTEQPATTNESKVE